MRITLVCLAASALLLAGRPPLSAAEPSPAPLAGGEYKPGALRLPLVVSERSGVARRGAVVASGVPFPPGFLADPAKLAVVDNDGKAVISQASAMAKWHKPAYDDSAQWALVSFVADAPANGTATYYLTDDGKSAPPASPLKVTKSDKEIGIETGAAKFVVPLAGDALLASASVGGKNLLGPKGLQCVATSGDWPERNLKAGDRHLAVHDAKGVAVEESGPARVVLAVKGQFKPGDKDGKFYLSTTRLYFEAGSPSVRVIQTVGNGRLDPKLEGGLRTVCTWPLKDASLVADLALGEAVTVATPAEDKPVSSEKELLAYQDSSGGDKWQSARGVSFRGYKVTEGEREVAAGNCHLGALSVAAGKAGISAALRNFRMDHPHAIAGSAKGLRIGLFPGEFKEPFHLNHGQRKSWDARLTFFADGAPDLKSEFALADALFLFRPEPAWMVRTAAAGCWPYGLGLVPSPGKPALRQSTANPDRFTNGWIYYGLVPGGWNGGGHHWNEETMYGPWVLWGDGACFDYVEASSLWTSDLIAYHWEEPDLVPFWMVLGNWGRIDESRVRVLRYPGWKDLDTWGLPDAGHAGMVIYPDYYFLTGDMRVREAIEHLGNRCRAMLWLYNHDDKDDGTGPQVRAQARCKRQDADADLNFKLDTRYIGWPLFNLANSYRLTGDPGVLADCRNIARSFRNTARFSPIGFMSLQIDPPGDKSVYGGQGPFAKYHAKSASQCFAHFQPALMCHGLWEYYLVSRDQEALDPMIGFADLMTYHAMLKDPQGSRVGWTYAFGDYWGPYTWEERGTTAKVAWSDWHYNVVEALGWIAVLTGRSDYVDVCRDGIAAYGPRFDIAAGVMASQWPRGRHEPPGAVADLKAEALGGGKVKLTWTAPAGSDKGPRAARYQVKHSTAKMVERISGWPDRTEPLPQNRKEWEARAAAFNAAQRAFWAATSAPNPPAPAAAGGAESLTVEGLAPGTYNFAVKAWGEADTMGPMSNVAETTVK
jgi:hypothetical protein